MDDPAPSRLDEAVFQHTKALGHLEGMLANYSQVQERLAKTTEELGCLRGQLPLLAAEVQALRRTLDDLLLRTAPTLPAGVSPSRKRARPRPSHPPSG